MEVLRILDNFLMDIWKRWIFIILLVFNSFIDLNLRKNCWKLVSFLYYYFLDEFLIMFLKLIDKEN